jgi:hypothetical protein
VAPHFYLTESLKQGMAHNNFTGDSDNHVGLLKDRILLILTSEEHVPLTENKSLTFFMRLFKQFIFVCYYVAWLYNTFSTKIS